MLPKLPSPLMDPSHVAHRLETQGRQRLIMLLVTMEPPLPQQWVLTSSWVVRLQLPVLLLHSLPNLLWLQILSFCLNPCFQIYFIHRLCSPHCSFIRKFHPTMAPLYIQAVVVATRIINSVITIIPLHQQLWVLIYMVELIISCLRGVDQL